MKDFFLERLKELSKRTGLKLTHQRLEIFRQLIQSKKHPSIEDLYDQVKPVLPTISLDTVYRTLALFEECGLVQRVNAFDQRGRFDANLDPHHHLICTVCKQIKDFYSEGLDHFKLPPQVQAWGAIKIKQMNVVGICRRCLKDRETETQKNIS